MEAFHHALLGPTRPELWAALQMGLHDILAVMALARSLRGVDALP